MSLRDKHPEGSLHLLFDGEVNKLFTWSGGLWCGGEQTRWGSRPSVMETLGWRYASPITPEPKAGED